MRTPANSLNARELRFVEQYLIDLNATQAAIRAGYSKKTARSQGQRLLTKADIASALQKAMAARSERTGITADRVLMELELLAFSDISHYVVDATGTLKLTEDAPKHALRAISGFKRKVRTIPMGKAADITETEVEIKLWDKVNPLKFAGRHVGIAAFNERMEFTGKNGKALFPTPSTMTDEELMAELAVYAKKAGV